MTLQYSDFLVSLVRSLDRADVAVRAASWFLQDVELEVDDEVQNQIVPLDFVLWAQERVGAMKHSLPGLRACVVATLRKETEGIAIEAHALGDACAPPLVKRMFESVWNGTDYDDGFAERARIERVYRHHFSEPTSEVEAHRHDLSESQNSEVLNKLPNWMNRYREDRKAIFFDGELFVVPHTMSDSFVEVWFRRAFADMGDQGAYPLYLVVRPYGWQCFGIER